MGAIGLALPWLLMMISLSQNPIKKTTRTSSSSSVDLKHLKMDVSAIANGDFTSLTGTWQNSAGLTLIFDKSGLISPSANKVTAIRYRDGFARAILTNKKESSDAYRDGVGIWFYPQGIATRVNGYKQDKDSIVISSSGNGEDNPYFKVSIATRLTDSGEADTSSDYTNANIDEVAGTYTLTKAADVKASPDSSAKTVATYATGQSINYDQLVTVDKQQWLSYLSSSGERRYVLMKK